MYTSRLTLLREMLAKKNLQGLLVSSNDTIGYLSGCFHFSAIVREALLLITLKNAYLFTDARFTGMLKLPQTFQLIETSAKRSAYDAIQTFVTSEGVHRLGFEENNLSVKEYKTLKRNLKANTRQIQAAGIMQKLRMIKDAEEIKKIKQASTLTDRAFNYILSFIRVGIREQELAEKIEYFFKKNGAECAFPPIVAFGPSSAIPHHMPSAKKLTPSTTYILFDIGARLNHYCADLSRTIFWKTPTSTITKEYETVHRAQAKAIEALQTKSAKKVDAVAREYILSQGYGAIPHAVGHGIGIAVHEAPTISPRSKHVLMNGMVVTIEPGIYRAGKGGIRIEDTVLIQDNKAKILTQSPKDLIVLSQGIRKIKNSVLK